MTKGWDWVIGTASYVAALVLTWLTLFAIERFGATDVRAWAPFLQAVLSAGAIFSAWFLQTEKRKADRQEAERDTLETVMFLIAKIEWGLSGMLDLRRQDELRTANLRAMLISIQQHEDMIRKLHFAHLDHETKQDVLNILDFTTQVRGFASARLEHDKPGKITIGGVYLTLYGGIFQLRSDILERHPGRWSTMKRRPPAALLRTDDDADLIDPKHWTSEPH